MKQECMIYQQSLPLQNLQTNFMEANLRRLNKQTVELV